MEKLSGTIDEMVKLIRLKMKYQDGRKTARRRKSDSDPSYLNDKMSLLSTLSENLASDDDVKPVILNYEDDQLDSCLNEERRLIEEGIILQPDERPEIKRKQPGPWRKTRKRKGDEIVPENVVYKLIIIFLDSFLKIERKKEEENIQKWALCIFSDNEAAWRQCDDAEMILPDGNDNNNGSSEAVCPNCGTRSRDLHFCEYCKIRFSDATKIIKGWEVYSSVVKRRSMEDGGRSIKNLYDPPAVFH
ncbi:hypothetical protein Fcan01_17845 [Folsomia candida]|uniref:Uncharacterized protein n=1 Tax=Folsomia candida TaxID=158441 RepID=A0A226DR49_FOLCA|nr:hypothetical protein Fcan01_17845 [Folsomia candida]